MPNIKMGQVVAKPKEIGSYEWYVNAKQPHGVEFRSWQNYLKTETSKRVGRLDIKGKLVKVLVGSGKRDKWYTGIVDHIGTRTLGGGYVMLQQKKREKCIQAWEISQVVVLDDSRLSDYK